MRASFLALAALVVIALLPYPMVHAEELSIDFNQDVASCACQQCSPAAPPPAAPQFGGCLCCRPKLTGDWWGHRDCYARQGLTFDADVTQFYFGVTEGGLDRRFDYGGHGDYVINADLGKLGVHEGLFLKL